MIEIIYGSKGSGKTKQIIDRANENLQTAMGNIVYITDTNRYMYDVKSRIRFLNTTEFMVFCGDCFITFICGLIAGNSDIEVIYIDGIARIANVSLGELQGFFEKLEKISATFEVNFVLTVSADKENLPEFIAKHIK